MKSTLLALVIIMLCSFVSLNASAGEKEESCAVSSKYVIRSLGMGIGTVSARMTGTASDNVLHADVDVDVGFLFFGFSLKSYETTRISGGKVIRYSKSISTGGKQREITGELDGSTFSMVIRDGEKVVHKGFPSTNYEVTNMEYPEVALAPGDTRRMRVLDLENSEVVDRVYRYVAEEKAEIDGCVVRVIVSDFADKNSECRRWTAIVNGLPIVRRQTGKDKTGLFNPSYSVWQTKVEVAH